MTIDVDGKDIQCNCQAVVCCTKHEPRRSRKPRRGEGNVKTDLKEILHGKKCCHKHPGWKWEPATYHDLKHYCLRKRRCENCGEWIIDPEKWPDLKDMGNDKEDKRPRRNWK